MSYHVLARKWRPRTFAEIKGQDHVVRALVNALDNDRVHHAFLFTGTRGVGKTSIARILAKALNCEQGVSSRPCCACTACREVEEGRFVDLIEVDAASRTGVDDTRELLDNVQYAPARGRYKVYLIDEVHMFSKSSFNALLKTLEEPPAHVKFLLATTDARKVPVTVLSRCLQFNLRQLPARAIAEQLGTILVQEGVDAEASALDQLAQAASGSMRDALSLLDQAISFGNGRVAMREVADMLGFIDSRHVTELLSALADGDAQRLLVCAASLDALAPDYLQVLADLIAAVQRMAVVQTAPEFDDGSGSVAAELRELAGRFSPEDLQLLYQIALYGRRDLPLSPDERGGFEMTLLRMLAFRPLEGLTSGRDSDRDVAPVGGTHGVTSLGGARRAPRAPQDRAGDAQVSPSRLAVGATQEGGQTGLARRALLTAFGAAKPDEERCLPQNEAPPAAQCNNAADAAGLEDAYRAPRDVVTVHGQDAAALAAQASHETAAVELATVSAPHGEVDWDALVDSLQLSGVAEQLARNCRLDSWQNGRVELTLDASLTQLQTRSARVSLEQALAGCCAGQALTVSVSIGAVGADTPAGRLARRQLERQREAERAIASDSNVARLRDRFGAQVRDGSVTPLD